MEEIIKFGRICKELNKEERKNLFELLREEFITPSNNYTKIYYPAEATEIQYNQG